MSYTIGQLKNDLQGKIHGTSLAKVSGINALIYEAARNVLIKLDPHETRRIVQLDTPLYDNVHRYSSPVDLKGNKIIDIRPQHGRTQRQNFSQTYGESYDLNKDGVEYLFNVGVDTGVKFLNITVPDLIAGSVLHRMDTVDGNGSWSAGGDAQNLKKDSLNKVSGNASLKFDLSGVGTSGFIENSTMTPIDLTLVEDIGAIFSRVYIPNPATFTSITLRFGNSSAAYWTVTATVQHGDIGVVKGWNRFRFDWEGATKVGLPDASAVNYLSVIITYDGTATVNYRVDDIVAQTGEIYEVVYYTKFLFTDAATGAFREDVGDDSDTINLDTESYNILLYEAALLVAQKLQGEDSTFDTTFFSEMLYGGGRPEDFGLYVQYKSQYKSETEKPRQNYYKMPRRNRRP